MQEDWPTTFSFTEKDLDTHYIGQWDIYHIDEYGTVKAGTVSRTGVVRSIVDFDKGVIKLVSVIPDHYGVNDIIMDGSTGFYGKISERALNHKDEISRVDYLYIKLLNAESVLDKSRTTLDGYKIYKTIAKVDDVVFNQDDTYSYPLYYFAKGEKSPRLVGMYVEIPITHFNHFVHMRNLWFRDYKGSTAAHRSGE